MITGNKSHLCLCHLLKRVVVLINVPHHISFNFTGYTHFPGLGQVSHNKWFVFRQLLISDWTFDDWIFMLFCQRLDFSRFLTWKFGFWEPSQQCLDLSCIPVWICLVSCSAETSKFSVIWRSAGEGNKQHIHSSADRKPENNNSSLKSRKQSFDIDVITSLSVKVWEC